jgi:hypothetical protein
MDVCNQRHHVSPGQGTALAVKRRAGHTQAAKTVALAEDALRMRLDRISAPFMCEVRVFDISISEWSVLFSIRPPASACTSHKVPEPNPSGAPCHTSPPVW